MQKTITAIISDTHIGSSVALAVPKFENNEHQIISASREQGWIYKQWCEYWAYVYSLCENFTARLIIVHLGDVIDGNHHNSLQILPHLKDQERMAIELLEPYALKADKMFFVLGTEAHAGPSHQNERRSAEALGAEYRQEWLLDIDGTIIHVGHHGLAGGEEWTSSAAKMAIRVQIKALRKGWPIPRYVFRGDRHTIDDSGEKVQDTRAITLPAWTLKTGYSYKVALDKMSDIGGVIMLPDGSLDTSRLRYKAAPGERVITHV